jgi:hypothetical protein
MWIVCASNGERDRRAELYRESARALADLIEYGDYLLDLP